MVGYYHHFGDFARDTNALSSSQLGLYLQLIHWSYIHETPLPLEVPEVASCLQGCNRSARTLASLRCVLERFFARTAEGWVHARVQRDIERYHAALPKREAKRENTKERQRRYRDNRVKLFESLRSAGCNMPYNATNITLYEMLERLGLPNPCQYTQDLSLPVTRDVTRYASTSDAVSTVAQAEDVTRLVDGRHNPEPITQNPIAGRVTGRAGEASGEAAARARSALDEQAIQAFKAIRKAYGSIPGGGNASDPRLRQVLMAGVTVDRIGVVATQCGVLRKPWNYLMATLTGQLHDAQQGPRNGTHAANVAMVRALCPSLAEKAPEPAKPLEVDDDYPPIS